MGARGWDRSAGRSAQLGLLLGAMTWIPARWGVMTTWDTTWLGVGYAGWNRLMLVPLTLLVAGSVRSARARSTRPVRAGWWVVAAGFAAAWIGVALEFVVGGGLRGGPLALAMAGWTAYLLGTVGAGLGAAVLVVAKDRDRSRVGRIATVSGAGLATLSMLAWPVLLAVGWSAAAVIDQVVVGVAWTLVALGTTRRGGTTGVDARARGLAAVT